MKVLQPVAWTRGTFLTPQHLQAQDAYFENLLRFRLDALSPWPWGFTELSIDHGQLERGVFAIRSASGLFPDGLPFEIPASDAAPQPRTLASAIADGESAVDFVLAVPAYRHSGANLASAFHASMRYSVDARELPDDNVGGREKLIQIARKNFLLLSAAEAREGYTSVAVARVIRTGPTSWALDPTFIPPSLRVSASQRLSAIAAELAETLLARGNDLGASRKQKNSSLASFTSLDAARFWLLHTVNSTYPVVRHLASGPVHPSQLFAEMLSLAGSLTTFSSEIRPSDLPVYDHDQPTACFRELDRIIRHLLETVIPGNAFSFPLRRLRPNVYGTSLDSARYLVPGATGWLGIRSASARPQDVLRNVPEVVKITSVAFIDDLYKQAIGGVRLTAGAEPESIPVKTEFHYFHMDAFGEDWERIRRGGDIAVYVPDAITDPVLELVILLPEPEDTV